MIDAKKRREVAKKMREYDVAGFKESVIVPFLECLGHGYMNWRGILDELADLMDPTCHVASTISYNWSDGTEYAHKLSCGHTCYTDRPEPPAFCDMCGCRVTKEEEENNDQ